MKAAVSLGGREVSIDLSRPIDISIHLDPYGGQPSCFGAPRARAGAYQGPGFVLDTRRGGSCNCETLTIVPHCNGTHTECVGHITRDRIALLSVLSDALVPARLVSIEPERADGHPECARARVDPEDLLISRRALELALPPLSRDGFATALIVRTLPNGDDKRTRDYSAAMPPYFTTEAMELICELETVHLLVDVPSVDRLSDGGRLSAHHVYWGVQRGAAGSASRKTITEMIYVPDAVRDGVYMLNLQVAPLVADASPSRPVLFEVL